MIDDEDEVGEYLKSDAFKAAFKAQVEKDTWGQGKPKIYLDKNGDIVEHWKDGTINILKTKEERSKVIPPPPLPPPDRIIKEGGNPPKPRSLR